MLLTGHVCGLFAVEGSSRTKPLGGPVLGGTWRKSSYSASNNECVEVRTVDGLVELRESDDGDVLVRTTPAKFARFLEGIKAGEFDHHAGPTAEESRPLGPPGDAVG
ncbi:DUF397 domain-containing protein [Kitasatospora sp. NPDC048239]|uniref:DUF397 domain-containing protein n=1 Tax=Kitasatospora sp. NPDC048239 TaxID=3364046 RepID=UPI00371B9E8F